MRWSAYRAWKTLRDAALYITRLPRQNTTPIVEVFAIDCRMRSRSDAGAGSGLRRFLPAMMEVACGISSEEASELGDQFRLQLFHSRFRPPHLTFPCEACR
jgi:hypothetical protein